MDINFQGKTALVTGGSRGIGYEIVKLLVACNANVITVSRSQEDLESLKNELPSVHTISLDLSDWNATRAALQPFGQHIDLLVNNAGYAKCTPLEEVTEKECDDHYNINVKAIINVTQCVIKGMKERRSGSIVNVSSLAGLVAYRDHLVYGASKAAVDLITKIMALELGHFNIRVNSVNPGVTNTAMAMVGWNDPIRRGWMLSKSPLRRFSEPEEIAQTVVFLLSGKSGIIDGINLPIDGGIFTTKM